MTLELFDFQKQAICETYRAMHAGLLHPALQMPTGAGKTETAIRMIEQGLKKGRRIVFVAPAIELIEQTVKRLAKYGITCVGVIQADHPATDPTQPVQVASVQTLSRRKLPDCDLVIVDECHMAFRIIFRWMQDCPELPFIGLSATPWTKGLGKHYDALIRPVTLQQLIDIGRLVPFRTYAPSHPDLTDVSKVAGDFHEGELAEAMDKPKLTADIVQTWLEKGENRRTFCFAVNRAHAASLAAQFEAAGVSTAYIDGFSTREERDDIAQAFAADRVKVVVNVGVLTTGIDWPVECIILARPTQSEILFVQIIGRGLRTAPGKKDCLILDHSDSTINLGFVTDIGHDHLDGGMTKEAGNAKAKSRPLKFPKECPACHALRPAGVHACPECGFAPQRREDVETAEGELFQLTGQKQPEDRQTKQRFWSGVLWYCEHRGWPEKRALAAYKRRFGVWPRGLSAIAREPDVATRNWIKASAIAWAKRQEKARTTAEDTHV